MNRSSAVIKGLSDKSTRAVILTPNDTLSYWNGSHLTRGPLFIQASGMLVAKSSVIYLEYSLFVVYL